MRKLDPLIMKLFIPIAPIFEKLSLRPNHLTLLGAGLNIFGVYHIARGEFKKGIIIVIFTWIFDVLDGALAKHTGQITKFGGFFDSVIDRYTEGLVLAAFAYAYSVQGKSLEVLYCVLAMIGALTVPYARARAEKEIKSCSVGIGDRLARLIVIALSVLLNKTEIGIILVAAISHFTVLQRIMYTRKVLNGILTEDGNEK
ncbi:MAG: CDP-alcohol phosphatidyltransferase family protein [Elusimicrobia bacterium]|nr:CDP-alcohol phosphatidyltransferase family protein [Elusimicrobiota bacterium]